MNADRLRLPALPMLFLALLACAVLAGMMSGAHRQQLAEAPYVAPGPCRAFAPFPSLAGRIGTCPHPFPAPFWAPLR